MPTPAQPEKLIHTVKEMAIALSRSEDYVNDMKRGGFRLPNTLGAALEFIHANGPPGKFRMHPTRNQLYGHVAAEKNGNANQCQTNH